MANASQVIGGSKNREAQSEPSVPLVVDLDGTLVSTDVLIESCFIFAKKKPLQLFRLPLWLAGGRARLKQRLAREAMPDVHTLPYHREFLAYLRAEKQQGRKLVLATAADEAVAHQVAEELGLFDAVFASDGITNLSGERKRDRLIKEFGINGFEYAGNSFRDRSVWKAARKAIVVRPAASLRSATEKGHEPGRVFEPEATGWRAYLHALRPHHWFKNALVFVPLIAAHQFYNVAMLAQALLAFAALSLCASSVYLLNDLVDLQEDRRHPHKRHRMLASGQLPVAHAAILAPILVLGAVALSLAQPPFFLLIIGAYCFLMLAYCLVLRNLAFWDALALAAGYCLRVVAGSVAVDLGVSLWLLSSVFLLFFGLALLKRYAELISRRLHEQTQGRVRGYAVEDSGRIAVYGCLSSYLALLVFAFYLAAVAHRHVRYELIWLFYVLLAYSVTHIWLMAGREEISSDPVSFALSDRSIRIFGILMAVTVLAAT